MKKKLLVLNTDPKEFSYGGVCPFMRNMHPYLAESFILDYMVLPDSWKKMPGSVRIYYLLYLFLHRKCLKKYDFILSHSVEGSYIASFSGVPYSHIYHGNSNPMLVGRFRIGKYFAFLYDKMFCRIEKTGSLLYTVGPTRNHKQKKLFNPLNQNVCPKPYHEREGFIFAGRLERIKNIDRLIVIYRKLPMEIRKKHHFYIAGYGTLESKLKKQVEGSGLNDDIIFLGSIPNSEMMKVDSGKKILLMASSAEGFPTAIAEALSVGVPVVSTDVGDISSIIKSGENGILLPVDFNDEEYIDAIETILGNYEIFSVNALNSSSVFNAEKITKEITRDIYELL